MDQELSENGMKIVKRIEEDKGLHEFNFTNICDNFEKVQPEF